MADKLTCIFPVGGTECGYEAPSDAPNALVTLQEHLRDDHLAVTTSQLGDILRRTVRWITHPNGTIGMLPGDQPWVEQEYTKIEWALPNGRKWLRATRQD